MSKIALVLLVTFAFLTSCTGPKGARNYSSVEQIAEEQPPIEQGEVWGTKETEIANSIRNQFRDMLAESTGDAELMRRDAHPKHHGCVKAELNIDNSKLKDKYKVGLFAENRNYQSWVRFSNGDPNHLKADNKADVRGMAVKLLDVPYQSYLEQTGVESDNSVHDFVFMNSKEFFIKDPNHYGKFMGALGNGSLHVGLFAAGAFINPTDHFVGILRKAFAMKVGNPLDIDYHSATPYKLGSTSMKMKFQSCKKNKENVPKDASPNFLSDRLSSYLDQTSSCFDFYIQPNQDKRWNNIENSQKRWNQRKSPYIKVGRLSVPKQAKKSIVDRNQFCENMSFNPWRAPAENRPMGGVNRIRLEVYVKQAKMRQNYNRVQYPGPSKDD